MNFSVSWPSMQLARRVLCFSCIFISAVGFIVISGFVLLFTEHEDLFNYLLVPLGLQVQKIHAREDRQSIVGSTEEDSAVPNGNTLQNALNADQTQSHGAIKLAAAAVLVIAGQGGSSTRAIWEIVNLVGTCEFGLVSASTKDSAVPRIATDFFRNKKPLADLMRSTRGPVYAVPQTGKYPFKKWFGIVKLMVENLLMAKLNPSKLRDRCVAACSVHRRTHPKTFGDVSRVCWNSSESDASNPYLGQNRTILAMKEPYLRLLLPFFSAIFHAAEMNFKFIHVTRDVREITNTHGDEAMMKLLFPIAELDRLNDEVAQLAEAKPEFNKPALHRYARFAYVWSTVELALYEHWSKNRASAYFHMSCPFSNVSQARGLARFLGKAVVPEATISSMITTCRPSSRDVEIKQQTVKRMTSILELPSMAKARLAQRVFGHDMTLDT